MRRGTNISGQTQRVMSASHTYLTHQSTILDLDEALVQFLDECNIKLENGADSYPKEYTQLSLNDISFTEGAKGGFEMTEEVEDDDKI